MKKMKLFVSLISAAVIAASTVLGASAAHYKGDIDRNDDVTISDVVAIQMHLSGKRNLAKSRLIYADMNDDNKINVFDLVLAKRVVLGSAPKEEVPSLTTPAVTTTVTTKTTTTTTKATTAATTKATTVATTKATTAATTVVTTKATTQATTAATTVATTQATTVATTAATTQVETTTTTEPKETTSGTTYTMTVEPSMSLAVGLDSTKEIDYIEFELDTSTDFNLHVYIDGWTTWFNIDNANGTLSYKNLATNVETVTINGDKVKVEFKENVSGQNLIFKSDIGTINTTVTAIVYVGDDVAEPVVTTATSVSEVITTTVTEATTTQVSVSEETSDTTTKVTSNVDTAQTGVAGTDVNRAMFGFAYNDGYNYIGIDGDNSYVGREESVLVPEIKGNGTYTVRFMFNKSVTLDERWFKLQIVGANGTKINNIVSPSWDQEPTYKDLAIVINSFKVDGAETTKSLDSANVSLNGDGWDNAYVDLVPLFETFNDIESIEVTFTITGLE